MRGLAVLILPLALGGCSALPVALLSTAGGVAAQALHLDAALIELWTAKQVEAPRCP